MINENEILENNRNKYFEQAKSFMIYRKNYYLKQGYSFNDAILEAECDTEDKFKNVLVDEELNQQMIIDVIREVKKF